MSAVALGLLVGYGVVDAVAAHSGMIVMADLLMADANGLTGLLTVK